MAGSYSCLCENYNSTSLPFFLISIHQTSTDPKPNHEKRQGKESKSSQKHWLSTPQENHSCTSESIGHFDWDCKARKNRTCTKPTNRKTKKFIILETVQPTWVSLKNSNYCPTFTKKRQKS
jgi:hypothetical protein